MEMTSQQESFKRLKEYVFQNPLRFKLLWDGHMTYNLAATLRYRQNLQDFLVGVVVRVDGGRQPVMMLIRNG